MCFSSTHSQVFLWQILLIHNPGKNPHRLCEYALGVFLVSCHLRCCAAPGDVSFRQEAMCPVSSLPHSCSGNQLQKVLECILLAILYLSDMCFDSRNCVADQILYMIRKRLLFCLVVGDGGWGSLRYVQKASLTQSKGLKSNKCIKFRYLLGFDQTSLRKRK